MSCARSSLTPASKVCSGSRYRRAARRPKQVAKAVDGGCRSRVRLGRRRHGPALCRRLGRRAGHDRNRARRYGQPPGDEPGHPEGHRWCRQRRAERSPPEARPRGDQRRALRRHGRSGLRRPDDRRCRRRPQGQGRAARVCLDRRPQRRRAAVATRVRVDGSSFFKGKVSCVLIGNVGTITGGLDRSTAPLPTTASSRSVSSPPRARSSGAGCWPDSPRARRRRRRSHVRPRGARSTSSSTKKVHYELDGGARGTTRRLKVRVRPDAITVCVPEGDR